MARAFEQYDHVDPRHRLIADELERRWNQKLEEVENVKTALAKLKGGSPVAGTVHLAGTKDHLVITAGGAFRYIREPRDLPYRPSVDVLFDSLAQHWRGRAAAALLTGMRHARAGTKPRAHEMFHCWRHEAGRLTHDAWHEEYVANRLAVADSAKYCADALNRVPELAHRVLERAARLRRNCQGRAQVKEVTRAFAP